MKKNVMIKAMVAGAMLMAIGAASATLTGGAAGSNDFAAVVTLLTDWAKGTLGKTVALGFFIVGVAAGITRGSIAAVVGGLAAAIAMGAGPNILDNTFTATV